MTTHHPSDCGCSPGWRRPKPNGTCAICGGWLPGERPPSLTAMWRGDDRTPREKHDDGDCPEGCKWCGSERYQRMISNAR